MDIWLTGDEHYNSKSIIEYCNRPFKDTIEMNEALIDNHNSLVKDNDMVYHVGDFSVGIPILSYNDILKRLNGRHILIRGNHDRSGKKRYLDAGFLHVFDFTYVNGFRLQHYPDYYSKDWHLCGHSHTHFRLRNHAINVGVDMWEFKPVNIDKLIWMKDVMEGE